MDRIYRNNLNSNFADIEADMRQLLDRIVNLESREPGTGGGSSGGDGMISIVKESFSGSTNETKVFDETMYGFAISNDGATEITFTIGGETFTVKAGEVFEEHFPAFTEVIITANGEPYRAYVKGLLGSTGGADTIPPNPVTNLVIGQITSGSLEIIWSASTSGDIQNYEVAYSTDGVKFTIASNAINPSSSTYKITGLAASTFYTVRVVAIDSSYNRSSDGLVTATTADPDLIAPSEVTNINANSITEKSLVLTWTASSSSDVAGYEIYKDGAYIGESTGTSYGVDGLSANTSYTFLVKAKDTSGNVSAGVAKAVSTAADTFPPKVTISPAPGTYTTTQSITLTADEPGTIYYTLDGTNPTTASAIYSTPISISENKTIKYFAKDTVGNSSTVESATYNIDITAPNEVTNLQATNIGEKQATLTWTASTSIDIAGYEVYNGASLLGSTTLSNYSVTNLNANTVYTVKVVSKDLSGNKSAGVSATFTTLADTTAPNEVTSLQATNINENSLTLTWIASTSADIASYDVYNGETLLGNTTNASYPVNGLSMSTTYTFTVKAKDLSGNISAGASITATTTATSLRSYNANTENILFYNDSDFTGVWQSTNTSTGYNTLVTDGGGVKFHDSGASNTVCFMANKNNFSIEFKGKMGNQLGSVTAAGIINGAGIGLFNVYSNFGITDATTAIHVYKYEFSNGASKVWIDGVERTPKNFAITEINSNVQSHITSLIGTPDNTKKYILIGLSNGTDFYEVKYDEWV